MKAYEEQYIKFIYRKDTVQQRFTSLALIWSFTFFTHREIIEIYAFSNGQKFGEKYLN